MCLAQLSYTNNNVRASGEFVHYCIPFFLALLDLLIHHTMLTSRDVSEDMLSTYGSHLECLKDEASDWGDKRNVGH